MSPSISAPGAAPEPLSQPLPDDLPANAPILNDPERADGDHRHRPPRIEITPSPARDESRDRSPTDKAGTSERKGSKHGAGLTEGDSDLPDLPKNNLWIVMPSIALVLFLAALDQTIVATALPTIAQELGATPSEYSWVGTAYLLSMTLLTPVNGRVSDIIGRKPLLYAMIIVFTVFSALCGAAKTMTWLIVARAFQGLGGGSIIGMTAIIVSDIVPLEKRGLYSGWLGGTWGIAAVLGPILGGLLTQKASWRWCFYINLPTCGIAFVCLALSLKLNPTKRLTFKQLRNTFDFPGLFLIMLGSALLIVGFSFAADDGFQDPSAYGLIATGAALTVAAILNFWFTKRNAIIPKRLFKVRTALFFTLSSMFHAIAFIPINYLLPEFFQGVSGADALQSGVDLLPFAVLVAWNTVIAGQINSRLRIIRPVAWAGYFIAAIGYAMFYVFFSPTVSYATQCGLLALAGLGIGLSLQVPLLILQASMPLKEMAAVTSAWTLTRSLGGSVGLAVYTAVLNAGIRQRFQTIPGFGTEFQLPQGNSGYATLHDLPDGPTKTAVLEAFADSLKTCWLIAFAFLASAFVLTLFTRSYSLNRRRGSQAAPASPEQETEPKAEVEGEVVPHSSRASEMSSGSASEMTAVSTPVGAEDGRINWKEGEGLSSTAAASPTGVSPTSEVPPR